MICRDAVGYLRDRAATTPEPDDRAEFEAHLAECRNCREFVREYDMIGDVVRAAFAADQPTPPHAVPPGFVDRIVAALGPGGTG